MIRLFRIIADDKMYEVSDPGDAKTLGDFLDIGDKVASVHFLSQMDGSVIGEMSDEVMDRFTTEFLALEYDPTVRMGNGFNGDFVFIQFMLKDGTTSKTNYWPESQLFWVGAIATDSIEELLASELVQIDY